MIRRIRLLRTITVVIILSMMATGFVLFFTQQNDKKKHAETTQAETATETTFDMNTLPCGIALKGRIDYAGADNKYYITIKCDDNTMREVEVPEFVFTAVQEKDRVGNCDGTEPIEEETTE